MQSEFPHTGPHSGVEFSCVNIWLNPGHVAEGSHRDMPVCSRSLRITAHCAQPEFPPLPNPQVMAMSRDRTSDFPFSCRSSEHHEED